MGSCNQEELKTKQDYIDLLIELKAYRSLDGQSFDFGTGLIINEMSYGSEDAYYEMEIQVLEELIGNWETASCSNKRKRKDKKHKRDYEKREKIRIKKLSKYNWMLVRKRDGWYQRTYRGKASSYLKRLSNKKIRRFKGCLPKKGNFHHKIFDFWWSLY
jgi:hypothetical protein